MATDEYLTVAEFAALASDEQHAIWLAHAQKRVRAAPVGKTPGCVLRYHRADVQAVLNGTEAGRG